MTRPETGTPSSGALHGLCHLAAVTVDRVRELQDVVHWGVLTIGTGLGNAVFTNRKVRQ